MGHRDGTHHALYEQKVVSPVASGTSSTGELGGRVAFGNTADEQYELIEQAYDAATRGGHSCQPIVLEVFGGFHPDAVKL